MTDYVKSVNYASKDALASGEALKIVSGTELNTEFDRIVVAVATKFDVSDRNVNNGLAPLDGSSLVPDANLPVASLTVDGIVELATTAETDTGTDAVRAVTPDGLQFILDKNAGLLEDFKNQADPGADRIFFWDDGGNALGVLAVGTGLTLSGTDLTSDDSAIVHDSLSGFVANEHIDHSGVTLTAGLGISGGGTIAASRSFALDFSELSTISIVGLNQADDHIVIDDDGVPKIMPYSQSGIKVATVTGTADTIVVADMNTFIEYTNGSAITITLNDSVGIVGNILIFKQTGAGQITVSGSATLESAIGNRTRAQNSVITLVCIQSGATAVWALYGDQSA